MDPIEGRFEALAARATEFVREHRLPGVAAAIVQGDRLAWFGGAGFSDIASRRSARLRHPVSDRVDHQDLHRHGDHAAARRRSAGAGRSGRGRTCRSCAEREPVRPDRDGHHPPAAVARGGADERPARHRLVDEPGYQGDPGPTWPRRLDRHACHRTRSRSTRTSATSCWARSSAACPVSPTSDHERGDPGAAGDVVDRISAAGARAAAPAVPPATGRGGSPTSSRRPWVAARAGPRVACSPASTTWPAGSGSSSEHGGPRDGATGAVGGDVARDAPAALPGRRGLAGGVRDQLGSAPPGTTSGSSTSGGLHGFTTNVCFDPRAGVGAIALFNGETSPGAAEHGSGHHRPRRRLGGAARRSSRRRRRPRPPTVAGAVHGRHPRAGGAAGVARRCAHLHRRRLPGRAARRCARPTATTRSWSSRAPASRGSRCVFHRRADGRVHAVTLGPVRLARLDPVETS